MERSRLLSSFSPRKSRTPSHNLNQSNGGEPSLSGSRFRSGHRPSNLAKELIDLTGDDDEADQEGCVTYISSDDEAETVEPVSSPTPIPSGRALTHLRNRSFLDKSPTVAKPTPFSRVGLSPRSNNPSASQRRKLGINPGVSTKSRSKVQDCSTLIANQRGCEITNGAQAPPPASPSINKALNSQQYSDSYSPSHHAFSTLPYQHPSKPSTQSNCDSNHISSHSSLLLASQGSVQFDTTENAMTAPQISSLSPEIAFHRAGVCLRATSPDSSRSGSTSTSQKRKHSALNSSITSPTLNTAEALDHNTIVFDSTTRRKRRNEVHFLKPRDPRNELQNGQILTDGNLTASSPIVRYRPSQDEEEKILTIKRDTFLWTFRKRFLDLTPENSRFFAKFTGGNPQLSVIPFEELPTQPAGIQVQLKAYQLTGLSFLIWLYRNGASGILGDEMGLGKTLQTLSLLQYIKENEHRATRTSLVICPLSVLGTWISEARKFVPSLKIYRFQGNKPARTNQKAHIKNTKKRGTSTEQYDLVVTTYETVIAEKNFFTRNIRWAFTILDEGHRIKNSDAHTSTSITRIKDQFRLILTGTPLQNDLKELWSVFATLYPQIFTKSTSKTFEDAFDIRQGAVDPNVIQMARRLLDVIMLRRTKESPGIDLKLPPKEIVHLCIPLSALQREQYLSVLTNAQGIIDKSSNLNTNSSSSKQQQPPTVPAKAQVGTQLKNMVMRLRQICSHPYLCSNNQPKTTDDYQSVVEASSKFVVLAKLIEEIVVARGEKLIVFSEWLGIMDLVEHVLQIQNIRNYPLKYLRLDGSTPRAKRNLVVRLFQDLQSNYRVIVVSTKTGSLGITLTAATTVAFLEEDWNPQVTLQAESRAHRLGQEKPVTIYKIYTFGTVEEQMLGRIHKKLYLSHKVTESTVNINLRTHISDPADGTTESDVNETEEVQMNASQLRNLIKRGSKFLHSQQMDAAKMWKMDFAQLIRNFKDMHVEEADDEVDKPLTAEEEMQWLSAMERVTCANFEGQEIKRTKPKNFVDHVDTSLDPRDRRKGKDRTVMVDGIPVLKETLQCREGESVPTITGTQSGKQGKEQMLQHESGTFDHEKHCHGCKGYKNLLECMYCPRAFHLSCTSCCDPKPKFRCGQHHCRDCGSSAQEAGGMLYRCQDCENAFCEDCLAFEKTTLLDESIKEFRTLGYDANGSAWFVKCERCTLARPSNISENDASVSRLSTPKSDLSGVCAGGAYPTPPSTGGTTASIGSLNRKLESSQVTAVGEADSDL